MKEFKFVLFHDDGVMNITTFAPTVNSARDKVMKSENCPRESIHEYDWLVRITDGQWANKRKTIDVYELVADYGAGVEVVTWHTNRKDAREERRTYAQNGEYVDLRKRHLKKSKFSDYWGS